MLTRWNLWETARARLQDAEVLLQAQRYDGAVYVCGYAVEIALKEKICRTLNWGDFPSNSGEFQKYQSFKTHDLDVLLHLSGVEEAVKRNFLSQWSVLGEWSPENRYKPIGKVTAADAGMMIQSAKTLLEVLEG
jgi:HEPN domain-containing protein